MGATLSTPAAGPATCGAMPSPGDAFDVSACNNIKVGEPCLVRCAAGVRCILGSKVRVFKCELSSTAPAGWAYSGTKINPTPTGAAIKKAALNTASNTAPVAHCSTPWATLSVGQTIFTRLSYTRYCDATSRGLRVTCQPDGKWTYVCVAKGRH